ncbi:MAG: hypothetical protein Q8N22_00905 [bacterium]|nr:hypothetical protein [bacterium]
MKNKIISLFLIFSCLSFYLVWPANALAGVSDFTGCPAYNGGLQGSDDCYKGLRGDGGSCEYGVGSIRGTANFSTAEPKLPFPEGTILRCKGISRTGGWSRHRIYMDRIYPYTKSRIAGLSENGYEVILEKGEMKRKSLGFYPAADGRYTHCTQYTGGECTGEIVYLDEYEKTLSSEDIPYLTKDCNIWGRLGKCVYWASEKKNFENLITKDVMEVVDKTERTFSWTDEDEDWFSTTVTSHVDYKAYLLTAYGSIFRYHKYQEESKTSWGGWGFAIIGAVFGAFLTPFLPVLGIFGSFLASAMPVISGSIFANLTMLGGYLTSQALGKTTNLDGGELTLVYVPDYSYSTSTDSTLTMPPIATSTIEGFQTPAVQPAQPTPDFKIKEIKP